MQGPVQKAHMDGKQTKSGHKQKGLVVFTMLCNLLSSVLNSTLSGSNSNFKFKSLSLSLSLPLLSRSFNILSPPFLCFISNQVTISLFLSLFSLCYKFTSTIVILSLDCSSVFFSLLNSLSNAFKSLPVCFPFHRFYSITIFRPKDL
ncbi:unnamed protein product [Trifolium pratense]|uniref:Uncharacterized protein n=1 Tax=Trifolium pratense TaxID=57577 RepID=A0ACB0LPQ9_TRIPR|nr:unnamed protein product [Trifolium pratense]